VVALSEGLRLELAPRGIGVSVLCPGFIRTQSSIRAAICRALRRQVGRPPATGPVAERIKFIRDRVAQGNRSALCRRADPRRRRERLALHLHDNELEPFIEARFAAIKKGFNQIHGRIPRR